MLDIALKMLVADRAKLIGLLFGIAFTAFLVTFAASYFCGFMTSGFALVAENEAVDVWVMDPAVESVEQTINLPDAALARVRSVVGVASAVPLVLGTVDARFANGRFQPFQVIGVDDATLTGAPRVAGVDPAELRARGTAIVDRGGTDEKLETPARVQDQWSREGRHLDAPTRELARGDEILVNDQLVRVLGRSDTLPRFPPRPLLYATRSNAERILPREAHTLTFVLASASSGTSPRELAARIERQTGLRSRTTADFEFDTVRWLLVNSEDVGDIAAMLTLAMTMGLGVTGIMLYLFTRENHRHYATLKALGTPSHALIAMVLGQVGACSLIGTGIGLGVCALAGWLVLAIGFPFRMMWFTPAAGALGVLVVSVIAAVVSILPVLRLDPGEVFAGR